MFLSLFLGLLFFLLLLLEGPLLVLYKLFFQLFSLSLLLLLKLYLLSLLLFFVFLLNFFALDFFLLLLSDFDLKQDWLNPLMGELDKLRVCCTAGELILKLVKDFFVCIIS